MNHTINTQDMLEAMELYVQIASSISTKSKAKKCISFKPSSLRYKVELSRDKSTPIIDRFIDPIRAMQKYNEHVV